MKLYDDNPQSKAMQSLIHDSRNCGDTIRFHASKLREWFKEQKISDSKPFIHLQYVEDRAGNIEKAIDAYYERFRNDFPETDDTHKPEIVNAYNLTLNYFNTDWSNEMMPTYKMFDWLIKNYTVIRNPDSPTAQQAPEPVYQLWDGGKWKTIDKDWYERSKPEYRRMVNEAPEPVEGNRCFECGELLNKEALFCGECRKQI